jgi:hypothetical protein
MLGLFLCKVMQLLLMLHVCFLKIGCANLVYHLRLCVTAMLDFSLPFGNLYVSVLIHAWLCPPRTILRQMGLQKDIIGLLNNYFVVTVLLSSRSGVNFWPSVNLL